MSQARDQFRTLLEFIGQHPLFSGLTSPDVEQLCRASQRVTAAPGAPVIREGELGDSLFLVLSGKLEVSKREGGQDMLLAERGPGEVVGEMSLLEQGPRSATAHAVEPTELLEISQDAFRRVLERNPAAAASIMRAMASRLRSTEASLMQGEKLASLGTLAAGLAHELNNPAAAIQRSSLVLKEAFGAWRKATVELQVLSLGPNERRKIAEIEEQFASSQAVHLSASAASRQEDALVDRLDQLGVPESWHLAPPLVAYGWTLTRVDHLAESFGPPHLAPVLAWLSAGLAVQQLTEEILMGSEMISRIVRAVKSYAYLDQAPVKAVDIASGIEDTLTILQHNIKQGVKVQRDFAQDLPPVEAYAGELNQVWTNLIDNALQAMDGNGILELHVKQIGDFIDVRIVDDGPGIPSAVLSRIFDPFFTTKPQGVGTGLGLHIARNIVVNRHRGRIDVTSRPGRTEFAILLPLSLSLPGNADQRQGQLGTN